MEELGTTTPGHEFRPNAKLATSAPSDMRIRVKRKLQFTSCYEFKKIWADNSKGAGITFFRVKPPKGTSSQSSFSAELFIQALRFTLLIFALPKEFCALGDFAEPHHGDLPNNPASFFAIRERVRKTGAPSNILSLYAPLQHCLKTLPPPSLFIYALFLPLSPSQRSLHAPAIHQNPRTSRSSSGQRSLWPSPRIEVPIAAASALRAMCRVCVLQPVVRPAQITFSSSQGRVMLWRPVPPSDDYAALGCVATEPESSETPDIDSVLCVHKRYPSLPHWLWATSTSALAPPAASLGAHRCSSNHNQNRP